MDLPGGLAGAFEGPVNGGTSYAEKLGNFNRRVRSRSEYRNRVSFLCFGELGLLSAQSALCRGDGDPFSGSCTDQVCLEFANHGPDIESEIAHGIGGVVDRAAEVEFGLARGEFIDDVLCIAQ